MATKSIRLSDGSNTLLPESAVSASGYQKCADGTLIQWGTASKSISASSTDTIAVSFLQTFTASPSITVSCLAHVPEIFVASTENHTTTGFDIRVKNAYTGALTANVSWQAIGRWK